MFPESLAPVAPRPPRNPAHPRLDLRDGKCPSASWVTVTYHPERPGKCDQRAVLIYTARSRSRTAPRGRKERECAETSEGGGSDKGEGGQTLKEGRALVRRGGRTPLKKNTGGATEGRKVNMGWVLRICV